MNAEFLVTSDSLGAKLCRDAIWARNRCNWIGPSMEYMEGAWRPVYRSSGGNIYNGTAGIALFLQRLFDATAVREYRRCALAGLEQSLSWVRDIPANCRAGFYSGVSGVAYAAFALGRADTAIELLKSLLPDDIGDHDLDVISGSAGAIPLFLAMHSLCGEDFLMDLATRHAAHLVRSARPDGDAYSWNTLRAAEGRDLTGFSHGASGIAWALAEMFARTGEQGYRTAAFRGFAYERRCFSPQHGNWPDFRTANERNPPGGDPSYGIAWCHGAPGIGLARLRAMRILCEPWCREDAEIAIRTIAPFLSETAIGSQNYCLCHGIGGNSELLLSAAPVLRDEKLRAMAERVGWYGIDRYRNRRVPWPCGVGGAGETPNLLLGLAGIGYFYLRLYDPVRNPSVLVLEQPVARTSAAEASS
jgi:lantibiotic biosynthesis protein